MIEKDANIVEQYAKKERLINVGHLQWKGNVGKITNEARTQRS